MKVRTSKTHPLQIDVVETPGNGRLGLTFCPGKHDSNAMTGSWVRNLQMDIETIVDWGGSTLVTLMEQHELDMLNVPDLGQVAESYGLNWYHLPIRDVSIPSFDFEENWVDVGANLRNRLLSGQSIVVHCRGGLGRTGLVVACLLIELGEEPDEAIQRVREVRPGAVETMEQERYVLN